MRIARGFLVVPLFAAIAGGVIHGCGGDDPVAPVVTTPDAAPECRTDDECRRNLRGNAWVCRAGACACPEYAGPCGGGIGGGCLDLRSDLDNCGVCGLVCPNDTTCSEGKCRCGEGGSGNTCAKPDAAIGTQCVANDCRNVWRLTMTAGLLAVGADDIFYREATSKLVRARKDGTTPPATFKQLPVVAGESVRLLAANATHVAWEKGGTIGTCLASECTPSDLATTKDARALRLSATDAFWFDGGTGAILRCALTGCGGAALVLGVRGSSPITDGGADAALDAAVTDAEAGAPGDAGAAAAFEVTALAVDGAHVYAAYKDGVIARVAIAGGAIETVAMTSSVPTSIAVDADRVFWTDSAGLRACAKTGCPSGATLLGAAPAAGVVVDAAKIYWASGANPVRIAECPRNGCPTGGPTLGLDTFAFGSLYDDAESIYVLETGGIVLRATKK